MNGKLTVITGDTDDFVSYSIDRWENGTFVEHEQETD